MSREVNTVLITIEEFDRLREIEKTLLDAPKLYVVGIYGAKVLYTKEEALKEVAHMNECLNKKIESIEAEITVVKQMLKSERKDMSQELADVKVMSWWQFRKWRKE